MSCPMAKFAKLPYALSDSHALEPFNLIHIDIWGPYKVATNGKYKYFLTIVDDFSRATWIYLLVQKSDNALEFLKGSLGPYMTEQGIEHQTSCVDRPQQNGRVEMKHRHVLEVARALRFHAHLPLTHWGDCVITATYQINRTPSSLLNNPDRTVDKFSPRGVPCLFLGYPQHQKGYKLLNLLTKKKFVSRDVQFYEHVFPYSNPQMLHLIHPLPSLIPNGPHWYDEFTSTPITQSSLTIHTEVPIPNTPLHTASVQNDPAPPPQTRRSSRTHNPPSWLQDFVTSKHTSMANQVSVTHIPTQFQAFLSALLTQNAPNSFREAIVDPQWCQAMDDELRALELNRTWKITDLPLSKKPISCHWIYKIKLKADGSEDRKKARLAVDGNRQRKGVDYPETFAPVAKMVTVRSLLAVAATQGWDICQMDVSNAFLHGDLFKEVYMQLPLGYTGQGESVKNVTRSGQVCKLKKSLYGLKQAPRQWFAKLSTALLSFGYQQSKADYSLFTKKDAESFTAVLVYVDDLLITGTHLDKIQELKNQLSSHFHMKDLGQLSYFLGFEVSKSDQGIFISQKKYTLELLKEVGVLNSKPYKLPMDQHVKLQADNSTPLLDPEVYRRLIGKLIYLTITRPDICFTVQVLSQFMQQPTFVHMQAVKHLLRYLLQNPGQGVLFANSSAVHLTAYCDSDWASCPMSRRTKHIEVDCHYVRDQIKSGLIHPSYVLSKTQLADVFTKVLPVDQHNTLLSKLGVSSSPHSQLEGECGSTGTELTI
ncbi:retrovirus-related pol polyprotein from transposon TNT 1-94 [Tanacetum coccineum]